MTNSLPYKSESLQSGGVKKYVLDTSVLLSDPNALFKFAEHQVVIPLTVITELEKKRVDPELGYFARGALRNIERVSNTNNAGSLSGVISLDNGGTLRVETRYDLELLPASIDPKYNDSKILATALKLGEDTIVVSKDLPMRLLASILGMQAETYRAEIRSTDEWSGVEAIEVEHEDISELFQNDSVVIDFTDQPPINTGVILKCGTSSALAIYVGKNVYINVTDIGEVFGVQARSAEQKFALAHLLRDEVGIVSIGGRAGTGKSAMALLAGIQGVIEQPQKFKKIVIFRPLYAVGGQDLGFLPGDHNEKMNPWAQAVFDTLEPLVSKEVLDELISRNMIEVLPLTHIRGRSLHNSYVIVDEAQSLERNVLLTVLSRMGQGSKIVLTHDVAQRDNLHVGRYDGIIAVIEALKGNSLFAHVTMRKSERSKIAELVTGLLDF